jgi:predicted DNA-binding transcriptional regulator AlpA
VVIGVTVVAARENLVTMENATTEYASTSSDRAIRTRADLMKRYGLGRSTLEKWYRERDVNGHPEAVGTVGRQLVWDAEAWDRWYAERESLHDLPAGLATRDELATTYGLSRHALKTLWAEREDNGHPGAARQIGKALYWDEAAWATWYDGYRRSRDDDSDGDPGELVTLAQVARILGLAQTSVTVYVKRPPAGWPEPAEEQALAGGRVRRLYRRADILAYAQTRLRTSE